MEKEKIKLGTLTKTHGISGEVILKIIPQWEGYSPSPLYIFIDLQGGKVPFQLNSLRGKGSTEWIIAVDTINSDEEAQKLIGADVWMNESDLGEIDEDTMHSTLLVGYAIEDVNFGPLGKIKGVTEIHKNPLLEIDYNGKEVLIPLQEDFILSVDKTKKVMVLQTPAGLIDLYLE